MPPPRRRLSELMTLYRLEPRARDVFVEGPSDKTIVSTIFRPVISSQSQIWSELDIDIDVGRVTGEGGARQRIIALSEFALDNGINSITSIVDRDVDPITVQGEETVLQFTTYTSLEFHIASLSNIRAIIGRSFNFDFDERRFDDLVNIAEIMYAIRLVSKHYRKDCVFPQLARVINIDRESRSMQLDISSLGIKLDSRNRSGTFWSELFAAKHAEITGRSPLPKEQFIHFHDFEAVVGYYLTKILNVPTTNTTFEWLGRLVRAQISENLALDDFLTTILRRLKR